MVNRAGSAVIACTVINAFAVRTLRPDVDSGAKTQYAFIAHHKVGAKLYYKIAEDMAAALGARFKPVHVCPRLIAKKYPLNCERYSAVFSTTRICDPGRILVFDDMDGEHLQTFIETCPDTRIVHGIRRPSSTMASFYLYEKRGKPEDVPLWAERLHISSLAPLSMPKLRKLNMSSAIALECEKYTKEWSEIEHGMIGTHEYIQNNGLNQIKEVRLEDLTADYDKATTAIFEHFLGKGHPLIHDLVNKAAEHDLQRQPVQKSDHHASDPSDTRDVHDMMDTMRAQGDLCMQQLQRRDALMGYDDSFWSSNFPNLELYSLGVDF